MKGTRTYVPVIIAVGQTLKDDNNNLNTTSDFVTPLVCIANKPLICYPLEFLSSNKFEEVIIVTSVRWEKEVRAVADGYLKGTMGVQYISIEDSSKVVGTVECLKRVCAQEGLIKDRDIMVMAYDLICEVNFSELDSLHRRTDSSLTILLSLKPSLQDVPVPLPKKFKKQEREITVFSGGELVHISSESGIDGKLTLKPSLLKNACSFEVHSDLVDCQLYLLSNHCLHSLNQDTFESLKNDFIPWLINNSFDESVIEMISSEMKKKYKSAIKDHHNTVTRGVRRLVCQAHVHKNEGACMRVHNVATFCAANFMMSKKASKSVNKQAVKGLTVCGDSIVGDDLQIQGRVNIKASVVGAHCSLGSNCRVSHSIVMSHAIIQQNVTLENCIVSESARVGEGSKLKECLVAQGQSVVTGNYWNKEILQMHLLNPV